MQYLRNDQDFTIRFRYGGMEYEVEPGEELYAEPLVIDHYVRFVGGKDRLTFIDTEDQTPEEPEPAFEGEVLDDYSWNDLRKLAKSRGIDTFGKKREEIEREINESDKN